MKKCFVIDIEASGLGSSSYPIEVAIVDMDSDFHWTTLIRPDPDWTGDEWDEIAEETVHGISRDMLLAKGKPADLAAKELWAHIAGAELISDAPEMDGRWLERLRQTAWPLPVPPQTINLAAASNLEANSHRALADATALKTALSQLLSTPR